MSSSRGICEKSTGHLPNLTYMLPLVSKEPNEEPNKEEKLWTKYVGISKKYCGESAFFVNGFCTRLGGTSCNSYTLPDFIFPTNEQLFSCDQSQLRSSLDHLVQMSRLYHEESNGWCDLLEIIKTKMGPFKHEMQPDGQNSEIYTVCLRFLPARIQETNKSKI